MDSLVAQVGIDVAKHELVVSVNEGKPFTVANTAEGCKELLEFLPSKAFVHLEASGSYERTVRRVLEEGGLQVRVHNPLKVRRLAQARGRSAKTDQVDAVGLSRSGCLLPHRPVKSLERQKLADLSRAIGSIKQTIAGYKRHLGFPELDDDAAEAYTQAAALLQAKVDELQKKLGKRLAASSFAGRYELLLSVPGVGARTAAILVCELPEDVAERTSAQISSFAGLAPIDDSSGLRHGPARLGHGNRRLKAALYMGALSAVRTQVWAKDLYCRLRAKAKGHQAAISAVMRRLLVRVVAVIKRGSPWQEEPLKT